jgi:hypothetical protein
MWNSWWDSQHKNAWEPEIEDCIYMAYALLQRLAGKIVPEAKWYSIVQNGIYNSIFDSFLIYWANWQSKSLIWIWGHHMFT